MKKKQLLLITVLMLGMVGLSIGYAGVGTGESSTSTIKAASVDLASIYNVFGGMESVALTAEFVIKNPNEFMVTLDDFGYNISAGEKNALGSAQIMGPVYIPAGAQITLPVTFVQKMSNLIVPRLGGGVTAKQVMPEVLQVWKKLGGVNPVAPLKKAWDSWPTDIVYDATGYVIISGNGMTQRTDFSLEFSQQE
jgi:LEA14-like dessication related protein